MLRGLVWLAHALADNRDYVAAEEVLSEADQLAGGDPVWELASIHGDCAEMSGDHRRALTLFAESLAWTSTTGESHQMLMDMRSIVINLALAQCHEAALEACELTELEERRTGRLATTTVWAGWLADAVATARANVSEAKAAAARARAIEVEAGQRARRIIQLAHSAVAAPRPPRTVRTEAYIAKRRRRV